MCQIVRREIKWTRTLWGSQENLFFSETEFRDIWLKNVCNIFEWPSAMKRNSLDTRNGKMVSKQHWIFLSLLSLFHSHSPRAHHPVYRGSALAKYVCRLATSPLPSFSSSLFLSHPNKNVRAQTKRRIQAESCVTQGIMTVDKKATNKSKHKATL